MRFSRTCAFRSSSARLASVLVLGSSVGACGDDDPEAPPTPSAEQSRAYFGLTAGSCLRYSYRQAGQTLFATATLDGPVANIVAGRDAYRWRFTLPSGEVPFEWLMEGQDDGEIRLLQTIDPTDSGPRLTRTYACFGDGCGSPDEEEPLLLSLSLEGEAAELPVPSRVETTTTPELSDGTPEAERHTVAADDEPMVTPPYALEPVAAKQLTYTRAIGTTAPNVVRFVLVPNAGLFRVVDGAREYTACDWRVCDGSGACTGAPDCASLSCE